MHLDVCLIGSAFVPKDLMGLFEKRRFRNFVVFASEFDEKNPATHKGMFCCNVCVYSGFISVLKIYCINQKVTYETTTSLKQH